MRKEGSQQKGWNLNDFHQEFVSITKLGWDSRERLESFSNLFARSLDLIVVALASKRTVPHDIFLQIRKNFADEIQDQEMEFVTSKVQHLLAITREDKFLEEKFTDD